MTDLAANAALGNDEETITMILLCMIRMLGDTRLVKRRDESVDSIEEVSRDFAPGDRGAVYRETTVRKSGHRPIRTRSSDDRFYDDRYDDRSYVSRRRNDDDYVVVDKPNRKSRDYDTRSRASRKFWAREPS